MKPLLTIALAALLLVGCGKTAANQVAEHDAAFVLPTLSGRVVDRADLISPAIERSLGSRLAALEARTTDQFVVVTLETLGGRSIEDVGLRLGRGWGIGRAGKNNGLLLIVAPSERKVRFEVGYGLEQRLKDEICAAIIQNDILPRFREGKIEDGIVAGVDGALRILDSAAVPALKKAG